MARVVFCRWCAGEHLVNAGVFPPTCPDCANIGRWSTEPGGALLERRKAIPKGPRVPFDVTHNDYKLFLRRIKIAAV